MIKGSSQQEDITIVNIYTHNTVTPKYIKQILTNIKEEIESNAIIVGDFNTHLHQWIDHPNRKPVSFIRLTLHVTSDKFNTYIQNISSKSSRIHILIK